jgi:hypothetical protein
VTIISFDGPSVEIAIDILIADFSSAKDTVSEAAVLSS